MAIPAPRCNTNDKSDAIHIQHNVAGLSGDLETTTISGKPQWCPQRTTLWVDSSSAAFAFTDEDGDPYSIDVPPGQPTILNRPVLTIDESECGDVNVMFEWWDPHGSNAWNA